LLALLLSQINRNPKVSSKAAAAMAPKAVQISATTGKPRMVRTDNGRAAAIKATKMTKEQWLEFQTDAFSAKWPKPTYLSEKPALRHVRDGGEGAYRDQTYAIVTRWTAKTQIQYRPHAKAPGSKSHVRYEEYAKAKTVGDALKRGSYPLDWCYDYEHGFIKVVGGEVRDEPLDPTRVGAEDLKKLTEVDNCLLQWYRRELVKKYGLKLQDLTLNTGEPLLMRAHRLHANKHATEFLASATRENRLIREDEVEFVMSTWGFARNTTRVNVLPEDQEWVWSDTIGLLRDRCGDIHLTKATIRYPEVVSVLCRWLTERLPKEAQDFKFTTLNLNKNYAAKRHRDGNNFGPSMIKAFGDYKQGELNVFPSDDRAVSDLDKLPQSDRVTLDIKKNLVMFNGNSAHEVNDYSDGDRYSIVYFTIGCHSKMTDECRQGLADICMPVPAPDEDPRSLLAAPPGYKQGVSAKGKTLRSWPMKDLDNLRPPSTAAGQFGLKETSQKMPNKASKKAPAKVSKTTSNNASKKVLKKALKTSAA